MEKYNLTYKDENKFTKLERALKKYNMIAYKKLNFSYYPALKSREEIGTLLSQNDTKDIRSYELELPADAIFLKIHGPIKMYYTVYEKEEKIVLETITPEKILLEGHNGELNSYKGVMVSKDNKYKDMFKADLLNMFREMKSEEDKSEKYINKLSDVDDKISEIESCDILDFDEDSKQEVIEQLESIQEKINDILKELGN